MTIADQIRIVRLNIEQYSLESKRDADAVRLLAVSKTHPTTAIQQAYASGVTEFGESYVQEAIEKIESTRDLAITWHFIGPLQSNKTRLVAENFDWVQSVDREKILCRLSEQRPGTLEPLNICIQANLFEEPQKQGASGSELRALLAIAEQLPNIQLRGIMVIPPKQNEFCEQMRQFEAVHQIYAELRQQHPQMDTLSMGMSTDMKAAILAQSTMVRVGTEIFGPRVTPNQTNQTNQEI